MRSFAGEKKSTGGRNTVTEILDFTKDLITFLWNLLILTGLSIIILTFFAVAVDMVKTMVKRRRRQ